MNTVEDYIEILTGISNSTKEFNFSVDRSDYNLVTSLARQTFRGVGLTDRQYELTKQKLLDYKLQFEANGFDNIEGDFTNLRIPLRIVDRSRWIKIVERDGNLTIAVRFIFQKKLISEIENLKCVVKEEYYDNENKIHYFPFNEKNVYEIVSVFKNASSFEVEEQLQEYYEKLVHMNENKKNYLPGIYGLQLKNLHEKSLDYAISSIGEPDIDNLCRYYDQRERLGIYHFDEEDVSQSLKSLTPLSTKIVQRTKNQVLINPKEHTVDRLAEVMLELYRFPLLVVLNEADCYDSLTQFHRAFNGIIPNDRCSVLFRLDNNEGTEFNRYIQTHELNSPVDKNTKIVYISNNKIPKPLLKSEWTPLTAITNFSGKSYGNKTDTYIDCMDLVIHYDEDISPWKRNIIEKI